MNSELSGKVILITGAAGGIGSALVAGFAAEGSRLVLHYRRNRAHAAALQRKLQGVKTLLVRADLTREQEVVGLFARATRAFGRVDTLVANAGSWEISDVPLQSMSLHQWRQTLDGVLTTTFLSLREFFRLVGRQRQGNAVLIGSTAAVFGEAGHADYAAAKAALTYGLTRSLKNEIARLAPHRRDYCGGRINCICPGWTMVPRLAGKLRQPAMIRKTVATMALPQLARPEDIAYAAVFLASDALARHITGQVLAIAGGMEGRVLWRPDEVNPGIVL
jgi:3-oxoacyl-[acyl-carrier protein] reductase